MKDEVERLIVLSEIRNALAEARERLPALESVRRALAMIDEVVEFQPGDLVEFETANGDWVPGVVIAHALHRPCYICGRGDNREDPREPILSCPARYVRARGEVPA